MEQVMIVGAGPAGLTLAYELALQGVRPVVLERRAEPRTDSPGVAINQSTAELLEQRGLLTRLGDDATALPIAHFSLLPLEVAGLAEHHLPSYQLAQVKLERMLEAAATELGAEVRYGHEVTGLHQDGEGVTVTVRALGGDRELRGRFLVGCDGAEGVVSGLAEIPVTSVDRPFYGLLADLPVAFAELAPEHLGAHYSPVGAHYMGVPIGPDLLRVITAEFDTEPPGDSVPVTLDELRRRVELLTGKDLTPLGEPRVLRRYANPTGYAERYRQGRVLLAGDAAHCHFPLNGLGLNTGIEDAVNLGWKLAAEINGWAPEGLLDTYDTERRPVGRAVVDLVRAQVALSGPMEKVGPLRELFAELIGLKQVHRRLLYAVTGIAARYPDAGPDRHTVQGHRLPPFPIETDRGRIAVTDLLRTGRGLVAEFTAGGPSRLADLPSWRDWVGRVDAIVTADAMPEVGAAIVLLRPDGRVAWAADAADADDAGLRTALTAWFGAARHANVKDTAAARR